MPSESTPHAGIAGEATTRSARRGGTRTALRVTAWSAAGVLLLGGVGIGYLYVSLNGNIRSVDLDQLLGTDRPKKIDNGSENILVLGSDTRSGANKKLGGGVDDGTGRSDTAMIVHLYKGHQRAGVVSIPRDTLIDRPACTDAQGVTHPAAPGSMFNEAYSVGGAACAVKTVESITGIRMDHYLEADFAGFEKLIDTVGGVQVTTTKDIDDKSSHLDLKAGTHTLGGQQALGLVRTRHGVGDGSDLGRIQLQQAFFKALVSQVGHIGVLTSPAKLYELADTATRSVTTDSDLASVKDLATFAEGLKGIDSAQLNMVTMPVQYDTADPNRVLPDEAKAQLVWAALNHDQPIPAAATKGTATGEATGVVKAS